MSTAHGSSGSSSGIIVSKHAVLVLTKEKAVSNFANKLKTKFQDVYIFNEYKLAIDALEVNSLNARKTPIDVVIVDCDVTLSLKLVDYVRKRPLDIKWSHLPLIAVVVMISDETLRDRDFSYTNYRGMIESVGGAHVYVDMQKQNFQSCVDTVNSVINRKYKVDITYQDLKQNHKRSKKVPYFPIFGKLPSDHDEEIFKSPIKSSKLAHITPTVTGSSEDASTDGRDNHSDEEDSSHVLSLSGASQEELFVLNLPVASSEGGSNNNKVNHPAVRKPSLEKHILKNFADAKFRPKLQVQSSKGKMKSLSGKSSKDEDDEVIVDLRQLMNRPDSIEIDFSTMTIGGIDRDIANKFWKDPSNSWQVVDLKLRKPETAVGLLEGISRGESSLNRAGSPSGGSLSTPLKDNTDTHSSNGVSDDNNNNYYYNNAPSSSSKTEGIQILSLDKSLNPTHPGDENLALLSPKNKTHIARELLNSAGSAWGGGQDGGMSSSSSLLQFESSVASLSAPAALSDADKKKMQNVDLKRTLKRLISETPLDLKLHNILDPDLSTRSISLAEREILEHGWKNELEGDITRCTFLYTKGAAILKESHLPKIFLANLKFKNWKYFDALPLYNQAIHKLSFRISGHYFVEDDFLAHYNRAVTKFRIGADDEGVADLEHALTLQPRNLDGLELMKIVQRRLRKYKECFAISKTMDGIVKSNYIEARELALQQQEARKNVNSSVRKGVTKANAPKHFDIQYEDHHLTVNEKNLQDNMHLVRLVIPSPKGNLSMAEKKLKNGSIIGGGGGGGGSDEMSNQESLTSFRMVIGMKSDIHTTMFFEPSPLQQALLCPPEQRRKSANHCGTIVDALRMIPYLMSLPSAAVEELAPLVEYRLFDRSVHLFQQNVNCDYVCLPIKGKLSIAQVNPLESVPLVSKLVDLPTNMLWGHIDMLFHDKLSPFYAELKRYVDEIDENPKQQTMTAEDPSMASPPSTLFVESQAKESENLKTKSAKATRKVQSHNAEDANSKEKAESYERKGTSFNEDKTNVGDISNISEPVKLLSESEAEYKSSRREVKSPNVNPSPNPKGRFKKSGVPNNNDKEEEEHRVLSSKCYSSGVISDSAEVLLMTPDTFNKYIFPIAMRDLKERLECIQASGLFRGWLKCELLRFARMGFVFSFNKDHVIIEQREKPDYLYFVMAGLVKAYKKPTLIEIIERKLTELRAKAERFDLKYAYNHKLRIEDFKNENGLEKTDPKLSKGIGSGSGAGSNNNTNTTTAPSKYQNSLSSTVAAAKMTIVDDEGIDAYWDNRDSKLSRSKEGEALLSSIREFKDIYSIPFDHTSISERARADIDAEIRHLESKYQKALIEQAQDGSTFSKAFIASADGSALDEEEEEEDGVLKNRCEIAVLKWPMLFGEDSVLDCDNGLSRGAIIAETPCRVFAIHKNQLQTFKLGSEFTDRVAVRMVNYPEDDIVMESLIKKKKWKSFRNQMMKTIPTTRWPKQNDEADPFLP